MKLFKVIPYNSLWFGGLIHTSAGEDHYLSSIRLPTIMVFFPFVKKETQSANEKSNWEGACYGVVLCDDDGNIFLPSPADIVGKRKKGGGWRILKFIDEHKLPLVRGTVEVFESSEGYFITGEGLERWKGGYLCNNDMREWRTLAETELKVGLQLNKNTGIAEERMLYFQERIRLRDGYFIAFLADECVCNDSFIGGERNPAKVKEVKNPKLPFGNRLEIKRNSYYRLYLLTHTYAENLRKGKSLKLKEVGGEREANFEVVWVYSKGSEFVSGYRKPAIEMLKPGTVLLLKAEDEADLKDFVQIHSIPKADKVSYFLESGWNTGILAEGGVEP